MELKGREISSAVAEIQRLLDFLNRTMDARRSNVKKTVLKVYTQIFNNGLEDPETVRKSLEGFTVFLYSYPTELTIESLLEMPKGTEIGYGTSGKIALEIQKYVHLNRENSAFLKQLIEHIEAIRPYCAKMPTLPGVEEGSELDGLIKEIFPEIASLVRSLGLKGNTPSREMLAKLTGSDVTRKLVTRLKDLSMAGKLVAKKVYEQIEKAMMGADPALGKFFGELREIVKSADTSYVTSDEASNLLKELEDDTQ